MPEGPEIRRAADRIARVLTGKELACVWFGLPRLMHYSDELCGCVDFFQLPVDGDPQETKWVMILIDGSYIVPYRNLGVLYSRHLNRPDLARKYWEAFLAAVPTGKAADEVREELEKIKGAAPGSPSP